MSHELRRQTLDIAAQPGRSVLRALDRHYETHYAGRYRFARLAFGFDLVMLGTALGLGIIALAFWMWKPQAFADKIVFSATVAPAEIVSGAPSTLVIRFDNRTGEELRDVRLSVAFPEHFRLLEDPDNDVNPEDPEITAAETHEELNLGTVPVDGTESIKIRGVMFGDVGGEQSFQSTMAFTHGERNTRGTKTDTRTFSPVRSTLKLSLEVPDKIVAAQPIEGTITYQNTGEIDFPEITVNPRWPDGFAFTSANVVLGANGFRLPGITAGSSGTLTFTGVLGDADGDVTFAFDPSFTFGDVRYKQETLTHVASIIPLPLQVSHSIDAESARPGASVSVTVHYANIGEEAVTDARVGVQTDSPFAKAKSVSVGAKEFPELARIEPGASGTVTVSLPLYASIAQSATSVYEHLMLTTRAFGTFDMAEVTGATTRGGELSVIITSPAVLDAFARYVAPSGDQIGRGPLPPIAGESTKYWIFWNLRGTTNELTNVRIEGELGENVTFTGRQTVSENSGVTVDGTSVVWTDASIAPTLAPGSKIIGIAFEVSLTPSDDQIGTVPTLLKNIRLTATDATTGAFVSASGATITTSLPNDAMAAGNDVVE